MRPAQFDYPLPADRIAQRPAQRRGDARLLIASDPIVHVRARDLPRCLPPDALVVLNDSRVVPARLHLVRDDGRRFELLVCDPRRHLTQDPPDDVWAWVRGARKLRVGDVLRGEGVALAVGPRDADPGTDRGRSLTVIEGELGPELRRTGQIPLPPYVERPKGPGPEDHARYQTVYARVEGSVAAPTAGLHLEPEMLTKLDHVAITLHIGPGTFLPMDVEDVRDHRVGREHVQIGREAAARIEDARAEGRPIVAVGTTVTRALEAVAATHDGRIAAAQVETDLLITPGFRFRVVDHLLTNFHLPRSSLLMLVCSFAGAARTLAAYEVAVASGYRFYSYGDCMLARRAP